MVNNNRDDIQPIQSLTNNLQGKHRLHMKSTCELNRDYINSYKLSPDKRKLLSIIDTSNRCSIEYRQTTKEKANRRLKGYEISKSLPLSIPVDFNSSIKNRKIHLHKQSKNRP